MTDYDLGTTIVLIASFVVIIIGIWVIKDSLLKKKRCNKETKGQIIGYHEILSRDEDKRSHTTYYCRYRYSIGNTNFEDRSDVGLNSKIFKVGSKITIRYNPENHRQHYIVESSPLDTKINIGVLFVFLGLLFFIPLVWKICK